MFRKNKVNLAKNKLPQNKLQSLIESLLKLDIVKSVSEKSSDYFLVDKANKVCVCISDSLVKVVDGEAYYIVNTQLKFSEDMKAKVRDSVFNDNDKIKKGMFQREIDLLNNVNKRYGDDL